MVTVAVFLIVIMGMYLFSLLAGNPLDHSKAFRRRRLMNWLPLGLTYAFLYMGRYNLTVSKNALGTLMTKEDFGIIFAAGTITYAFAFLINGPLTDRIGGKKAILIGALGAALMNGLMGLLTYWLLNNPDREFNLVFWFSCLYAVNMYFQSYGAVAIVKVNSNWFHVRERGSFGGMFGVLISLGIFFAFDWGGAIVEATSRKLGAELSPFQQALRWLLVSDASQVNQIWWVFWIPALVLFTFFCLDLFLLRDEPGQAGLHNFDTGDASSGEENQPFNLVAVLKKVLTNPIILTIAFVEFCSGVMRNGIMHWYPIYSKEIGLASDFFFRAHWGLILCVAGITGGMLAGFLSDKVFGSRRGPVAALLYANLLILSIVMVFTLKADFLLGVTVALMSLSVIGVHGMLSGTATMDFGGRRGAATAVGIIDGFVYLGTGVQSLALGYITTWNWNYWPIFLIPFALLGLVLACRIWQAIPEASKTLKKTPGPAAAPQTRRQASATS